MDKSHKHRKGFRQDAELLGEAYESVHDSSQQINEIAPLVAAGLGYLGGAAVKGAVKGIYKGVTDPATPRGSEEINVSTSDQVEDDELSDDWMERDWKSREEDLHPATRAGEEIIGSDVIWDNHQMKGIVKKVDVELGMAIAIDHKGEPHIVELGAVDAVLDPNTETPEEFKHLY